MWNPVYGWVKIVDIGPASGQWRVELEGSSLSMILGESALFFGEFEIPGTALTRPKPRYEFQPGDPVIVWDDGDTKSVMAFVKYRDDGRAVAQADNTAALFSWDNCVPYDRRLLGFEAIGNETTVRGID